MPADRGRASKACATCRKQKTRCYAGNSAAAACLRCQTLALQCSFEEVELSQPTPNGSQEQGETSARLRLLENTLSRLVERIDQVIPAASRQAHQASPAVAPVVSPRLHGSRRRQTAGPRPIPHAGPAAPMQMIHDLAVETGHVSNDKSDATTDQHMSFDDIITQGLVTYGDVLTLVAIFQEHYGRWLAINEIMPAEALLDTLRRSDLLLCACCLISVRHTTLEQASFLAPVLFERAKGQVSSALLTTSPSIEFFQAAVILSMWCTTIGQTPLSIDSWLLSGFALQHCQSSNLFDAISNSHSLSAPVEGLLTRFTVWNHLCLVHLHYCVGTRRRAMIGPKEIAQCEKILGFDSSINFQTRMVAEINLYWCMYESCTVAHVDLVKVQNALRSWKTRWEFLLDQPRAQFLQMGFNFAHLLAYERALQSKSAKVKYKLLTEMATLCVAIINLAIQTTDDRTKHLSDHIYHLITFAAITLCRLLNLYEAQIATTQNVADLDALILNLVNWMHSIGLPCHVGYMFGTLISACHRKLRPEAHLTAVSPTLDWSNMWNGMDNMQYFPEWLAGEQEAGNDFSLLPDWEPYYQGPPT